MADFCETLKWLLEKATPGKWFIEHRKHDDMDGQKYDTYDAALVLSEWCEHHPVADCSANHTCGINCGANAAVIAYLRNHAEAILRVVEAAKPFRSGAQWGKWKAWLVNGAPSRDKGIAAARQIVKLQMAVDEALAALNADKGV